MALDSYTQRCLRSGDLPEAACLVHRHAVLAVLELNRPRDMRCTLDTLAKDKMRLIIQIARILEMAVEAESRLLLAQIYLVCSELRWAKVYNMQTELKRCKSRALILVYAK